jgi:hypothetical protein
MELPMISRRQFLAAPAVLAIAAEDPPDTGLPDFSNCGYGGGGVELPKAAVRTVLKPEAGDATARIQAALDQGGVVGLAKGEYEIGGTLRITKSGVVLRGEDGATLLATGAKPRAVVEVQGTAATFGGGGEVSEDVPVGARTFRVTGQFQVGQVVVVRRKSNAAWIHEIGMDRIADRPGDKSSTKQWAPFNLDFERTITAVDGDRITVDAPIFCAIERRWGGGEVLAFDDRGRITQAGVENLRAISSYDRSVKDDEAHAESFVVMDNANDCWVKSVSTEHFSFACVHLKRTRHVTVEDCNNREMISQITGSRRYTYCVSGQLSLVQRCKSDTGRHDFVVEARVPGPNVFLDCQATHQFATSEPHHRWSVGGLYDNVKANIAFQDRQWMGTGHGWSGANYVAWNCEGSLVCQSPPTATNWAIGQVGKKEAGAFAPKPDGVWRSYGRHVQPRSLYLGQLAKRLRG